MKSTHIDDYINILKNENQGGAKKYLIKTYGCQMNENDSEKMAGILSSIGYEPTDDEFNADIVILNTCSVRENANDKFFGHLGRYKKIKEENPGMILCICGCMMQQESIVNELKNKYRYVDLIFGTHNIHQLPELLVNFLEQKEMVVQVWEDGKQIIEDIPTERKYDFKAYVSIMYGCNNFCSYCIVPYTRGRERSREPEKIIQEVESLASTGCKEIMLLGQNVNSYGKTLENPITFAQLLRKLCKVDGIERIRFMTSHPKDLSDELIDTIAAEEKICKHIHLPFQAGNNRILKAMNRKYTKEDYLTLVEKIKAKIPGIALTTDIIVGFPGETDEEFEDTLDVVRKCQFDAAFTFLYSIREGTPAEKMEDQVPEEIKHKRFDRLVKLQTEIGKDINEKYVDKVVEVLVEGPSKNNKEKLSGRTDTNKLVNFTGNKEDIGKIVTVKITKAKNFSLEGVQLQ